MKPLSTTQQIEVLKELLRTWDIYGMCIVLYRILKKYGIYRHEEISDYIPSFTHYNYLHFYSSVKSVQKNERYIFWDNLYISGRLRRRKFIRHLIKELEKQLKSDTIKCIV